MDVLVALDHRVSIRIEDKAQRAEGIAVAGNHHAMRTI